MIIWGEQDTFKTWMAKDLAWSVAEGKPWLTFPTNQHNVLLINTEMPEELYWERWQMMARSRGSCPENLWVVNDTKLKLDTDEGANKLYNWCKAVSPGLIIIDNLFRSFAGDMSSGHQVNKMLDTFAMIRADFRCATCHIHHSRKTAFDIITKKEIYRGIQDMTGHKNIANNASTVFETRRIYVEGYERTVTLIPEKLWFTKSSPPELSFSVEDDGVFRLI